MGAVAPAEVLRSLSYRGRAHVKPACHRRIAARLLGAFLMWPAFALAGAVESAEGRPLYQLPEPGSYKLPVIDRVGHHELLSFSEGRSA